MKKNKNEVSAMSHNVCSVNSNCSYKIQIRRYGEWWNVVSSSDGSPRMVPGDSAILFLSKRSANAWALERINPDLEWRVVDA